jgi:hypothetical protein
LHKMIPSYFFSTHSSHFLFLANNVSNLSCPIILELRAWNWPHYFFCRKHREENEFLPQLSYFHLPFIYPSYFEVPLTRKGLPTRNEKRILWNEGMTW